MKKKLIVLKEKCHYKWLCLHCLKHGKGSSGTCGINGHKIIMTYRKSALPSPSANRKEWQKIKIYFGSAEIPEYKENLELYLKTIGKKK